ncbi:hypothetical protein PR202_ga17152 [Eleusine coracana subsp. coracana]|uniref:Uncharacterized protein n=1 Tax=Eleusine coracana subsp. coracana TaxID=191504 RepID=A0AAV5CPF0_ELECO|nr:hypothetical protein PR202_ga17152 [Eleusine coracana subsp. coracana]
MGVSAMARARAPSSVLIVIRVQLRNLTCTVSTWMSMLEDGRQAPTTVKATILLMDAVPICGMMMGRTGPRSLSVGVAAEVLLCLDVQLYADVDVVEVTCHPHRLQVGVLNDPLLPMVVSHHAPVAEEWLHTSHHVRSLLNLNLMMTLRWPVKKMSMTGHSLWKQLRKGPPDHEELLQKMFGGVVVDGSGACVPGQVIGHEDNDRSVGGGVEEGFLGAGSEEGNVGGGAATGGDGDVGRSPAVMLGEQLEAKIKEVLDLTVECGAGEGSAEHFMATCLLNRAENRATFKALKTNEARLLWLKRHCAKEGLMDNDGTNDEEDMSITIARGRVGALRTFGVVTTTFAAFFGDSRSRPDGHDEVDYLDLATCGDPR